MPKNTREIPVSGGSGRIMMVKRGFVPELGWSREENGSTPVLNYEYGAPALSNTITFGGGRYTKGLGLNKG